MREGFTSGLKPGHEHWGTHVWQEGWAGWQRKHSEIGHTGRWGGLTQWDWAHRQVRGPGTVRAAHRQVTESGHTGEGAMEQKGWDEGESLQGELENHWVHSTWRPCTVIVTVTGPQQGIQGTLCSPRSYTGSMGATIVCGPLGTPAHHSGSGPSPSLLLHTCPALNIQSTAPSCLGLSWRFAAHSVPAVLTCLVFFLPKFLMYMSYSFTGGRSKKENVNEKSRSMSRSNFVLRVLENKLETDKLNWAMHRDVRGAFGEMELLPRTHLSVSVRGI